MTDTTTREDHAAEISRLLDEATDALFKAREALVAAALLAPLDLYADEETANAPDDLASAVRVLTYSVTRDRNEWASTARARAMRHA
ncbi:hypothetical protein [Clavibacter capsici]|uniref:hypothetical protein n=1 Tax=Clavibacter capsici TaxID=1874630 RepID=UPI0014280905|nr:hypothetical protein [Clavibacter capsici]QIS38666.1 hypothetical protein GW572_04640 [Clavibacter capsici]